MISWADIGFGLWLGILTSISPCPLATNIAAISFIGRNVNQCNRALISGLSYAFGRVALYVILGMILVSSTRIIPNISMFLQKYMNLILGPVLLLVGLFLLNIIRLNMNVHVIDQKKQENLARQGIVGAFLLGILFALSFCPVSAALFFGNTIGLAVKNDSRFLIPGIYGLGTALPVVLFAFIISYSMHAAGRIFKQLTVFEKWARRMSGVVFILAGLYSIFQHFVFAS